MWLERCDPREQYWANGSEVEFRQLRFSPVVILLRADDEFDFVSAGEVRQVLPAISSHLAAAWTFQIHDAPHTRIQRRNVERAAGFNQHGETIVAKRLRQGNRTGLKQRFAARQFNQRQADGITQIRRLACPPVRRRDTGTTLSRQWRDAGSAVLRATDKRFSEFGDSLANFTGRHLLPL